MTEVKTVSLCNRFEAIAFGKFMRMEQTRHMKDVKEIELSLVALKAKWGICDLDIEPDGEWVEIGQSD